MPLLLDINQDNRVNKNLSCYKPLGIRRAEAKNLAFVANITPVDFPSYPEATAINFEFLHSISSLLSA